MCTYVCVFGFVCLTSNVAATRPTRCRKNRHCMHVCDGYVHPQAIFVRQRKKVSTQARYATRLTRWMYRQTLVCISCVRNAYLVFNAHNPQALCVRYCVCPLSPNSRDTENRHASTLYSDRRMLYCELRMYSHPVTSFLKGRSSLQYVE